MAQGRNQVLRGLDSDNFSPPQRICPHPSTADQRWQYTKSGTVRYNVKSPAVRRAITSTFWHGHPGWPVRDGRVTHYSDQYDAYVYKVNKEIEAGERELASTRTKLPADVVKPVKAAPKRAHRDKRVVRKELKTLEKTVAQLDEQKRALNAEMMKSTDAAEALRLHNEITAVTEQLTEAEERWCELQEELEGSE